MKKIIFCCVLAAASYASELYSAKIINLYASADAKKPEGKLLPTNAFEIVKNGDLAELKIKGFYNPKMGNVLYFTDKNRILVAAFGKKSNIDFKIDKELANGYALASITAYAKASELEALEEKVEPLFAQGKELFSDNCGICHPLHPTSEFSANQWPAMFKAMQSRTAIEKDEAQLVVQYLQKHAKDMKEKK